MASCFWLYIAVGIKHDALLHNVKQLRRCDREGREGDMIEILIFCMWFEEDEFNIWNVY